MELKFKNGETIKEQNNSSNRTFMELKCLKYAVASLSSAF